MSIKRQLVVAALLAVPLLGLFFWWGFRTPPFSIINGRTLVDWLREVEFEGFQHKVAANEVLYAAGPKIIPTLSRVLRQPHGYRNQCEPETVTKRRSELMRRG